MKMSGQFIGVGVGPGDPELITMKAWKAIQNADVISFLANEDGRSQAKGIAEQALAGAEKTQLEIAVKVPMVNDRSEVNKVYDEAAVKIQQQLSEGKTVVFLCEGDPLFFGSFSYLLERLQEQCICKVVPGISSVHAASSTLKLPLVMLKESFVVISGRHSDEQLNDALQSHDTVVILKAGRSRQRIIEAITRSDRVSEAKYLEYIGRDNERVVTDIQELGDEPGPYFSLFVVIREERDRS